MSDSTQTEESLFTFQAPVEDDDPQLAQDLFPADYSNDNTVVELTSGNDDGDVEKNILNLTILIK